MAKFSWTLPEVYEELQQHGFAGLLHEFRILKESMQGGALEDVLLDTAKESYDLMNAQIMNKIKNTGPIFFLTSVVTHRPYLDCYDLESDFRSYLFSDQILAEKYQSKLLQQGCQTEISEILTGRHRTEYFRSMMLAGINYLVVNPGEDQYPLLISQLVEIPAYDGFFDINNPLYNCKLNALLAEYLQDQSSGGVAQILEDELFRELKSTHFLLPAVVDGEVDRLDHKELIYKYLMMQRENKDKTTELCMPVFTDNENMDEWIQAMKLEEHTSVIVPFEEFFHLMETYNVKSFIINWNSFAMILSPKLLAEIRNVT